MATSFDPSINLDSALREGTVIPSKAEVLTKAVDELAHVVNDAVGSINNAIGAGTKLKIATRIITELKEERDLTQRKVVKLTASLDEERQSTQEQIERARREEKALAQEEIQRAKKEAALEIDNAKSETADKNAQLKEMEARIKALMGERNTLKAEVHQINEEKEASRVAQMESLSEKRDTECDDEPVVMAPDNEKLIALRASHQTINEEFRSISNELGLTITTVKSLQQELERAHLQKATLESELHNLRRHPPTFTVVDAAPVLEDQVCYFTTLSKNANLIETVEKLRRSIEQKEKTIESLNITIANLNGKLSDLQHKQDKTTRSLQNTTTTLAALREASVLAGDSFEGERISHQRALAFSENENRLLITKNEQLAARVDSLQLQLKERNQELIDLETNHKLQVSADEQLIQQYDNEKTEFHRAILAEKGPFCLLEKLAYKTQDLEVPSEQGLIPRVQYVCNFIYNALESIPAIARLYSARNFPNDNS